MQKIISIKDTQRYFKDDMSIMYGGFMVIGTPEGLVRALLDHGARNLTLIGNDRGFHDTEFGPLVVNKRVKKLIAGC